MGDGDKVLTVGLFGHSLSVGVLLDHKKEIEEECRKSGLNISLYAVEGTTAKDPNATVCIGTTIDWANGALQRRVAEHKKFDALIIYAGANDVGSGERIWNSRLKPLIALASKSTTGPVFVFNLHYWEEPTDTEETKKQRKFAVKYVNNQLVLYAAANPNVVVIDTYAVLNKGDKSTSLHPSGSYGRVRDQFLGQFKEEMKPKETEKQPKKPQLLVH